MQTSREVPYWYEIKRGNIEAVANQKIMEEDYLASKDPGPKIKPMSLDVQSAPTCFDKIRVILSAMRGCTGIPLSYVIRLRFSPQRLVDEAPFGNVDSHFGSINEELVVRAPILQWEGVRLHKTKDELEEEGPFTSAFATDMKKVYQVCTKPSAPPQRGSM